MLKSPAELEYTSHDSYSNESSEHWYTYKKEYVRSLFNSKKEWVLFCYANPRYIGRKERGVYETSLVRSWSGTNLTATRTLTPSSQ